MKKCKLFGILAAVGVFWCSAAGAGTHFIADYQGSLPYSNRTNDSLESQSESSAAAVCASNGGIAKDSLPKGQTCQGEWTMSGGIKCCRSYTESEN